MTGYTEMRINGIIYGLSSVAWALLAATEPRQDFAYALWVVVATHAAYSVWSFVESRR